MIGHERLCLFLRCYMQACVHGMNVHALAYVPACTHCQRKLGSNTSEVRTNRILSLEMMKGGARLTLDLEGWCAIET